MQDRLNKNQLEAIHHGKGPLLIIAGAGTGKTTVITERIKYLIVDRKILPHHILALTFTEKAASQMQEKVDILLPYGYSNLWINTFHSFCDRILRDEAHSIGLDPNYKLISESEAVLLMKQNIFNLGLKLFRPLGNPTKFLNFLLSHFSRLKDEDILPSEYIHWTQSQKAKVKRQNKEEQEELGNYLELAHAYQKYEELKIKEGSMDFSDLISNTLRLFRERRNVLKRYQNQFKFILVDEFQDTNLAQNELAILLAGKDKNITVVADDDQSIYRFRGAAVSNVLQFKEKFKKAKIITLTENYRSTQVILDASYKLIQHNNPNRLEVVESINKKLRSNSKAPNRPVELIHKLRSEDEGEAIAKKIKGLTMNDARPPASSLAGEVGRELSTNYQYKDIAILIRANNHAQAITNALKRSRVPYQFLGPGYLFQQEEIKDLIAYLFFLADLTDSISLFRVLSMDIFAISYIELNYLLNFAKKKNLTLFEALNNINQTFLNDKAKAKLEKFTKMVKRHLEKGRKEKAGQILYYFLVDCGLFHKLQKVESVREEKVVQNIAKFFDRIKNFEQERSDSNIFTVVEWLNLMLQMEDSPLAADIDLREANAVNVLTVHSSKGLEFKVVFMVNLVSDRFPTRERKEKIPLPEAIIKEKLPKKGDFHLEEERRLFYVGMTRAKELLIFTAANYYNTGKREKRLSPFIYEALPDLKEEKLPTNIEQLSLANVLEGYKEEERGEEKKPPFRINYITFSNLQMFDICPLHYKAKVILSLPTPIASAQSFGISLHNTLCKFYRKIVENLKPTLTELENLLKIEWINDGYDNKKHEEERFEQAKNMLRQFYKTECNPPIVPLKMEYPFNFTLKNKVKVFGKIDRIDKKGKEIEIIDYKTGEDNPKASRAHELQLAIYALAATRVKDDILNRDPQDITLTLHFLDKNTKKSMNFKKEDLDKLEETLIEKIGEIEKSDFACSGNVLCFNCEYKILCNTST